MSSLLNIPQPLKPVGHYVKIANELKSRDPVLFYWCLMYSAKQGMELDRSSAESKAYLGNLVGELEKVKSEHPGDEAFTNDLIAQAHIEEYALKLFVWADNQDRSGVFNKNVVKAFYTSGHLLDLLNLFPESGFDDKTLQQQKYAKWKAAYIHNCLKNGETPIAGPLATGEEEEGAGPSFPVPPAPGFSDPNPAPPGNPIPQSPPASSNPGGYTAPPSTGISTVSTLKDFKEVQKLCKYAISALEYEDAPTAIAELEKALAMLKS